MSKKLKPVHPGEILHEEFMTPLGLSMNNGHGFAFSCHADR
jgi:plasmid maintenance system antidote protein VapI